MKKLGRKVQSLLGFNNNLKVNYREKLGFRLIKIYSLVILVSFALIGLKESVFPFLTFCINIFGPHCEPVGSYIATLASLPGYLIVSILVKYKGDLSPGILFIVLFTSSILFYYLLGLAIDKYNLRVTKKFRLEHGIILIFIVLLISILFFATLL